MERWRPQRPMIIAPALPLMWTSSWLSSVTACRLLGTASPSPKQLESSVLLVSLVVLLANIYNLILICQRIESFREAQGYVVRVVLLALVMICSLVLAWGQPTTVLIPNHLTCWVAIFLILNFIQALLGQYFVAMTRPMPVNRLASTWLPLVTLLVTGLVVSCCLVDIETPSLLIILIQILLVVGLTIWQWQNLAGLLQTVDATKSVIYQILVGINLSSSGLMLVLGINSFLLSLTGGVLPLISYCFTISMIAFGLSGIMVAAMQRYDNDYRYGHVHGKPIRYLLIGMLLLVIVVLVSAWLQV